MKRFLNKRENIILVGVILCFIIAVSVLTYYLDFYEDEIYSLKSTDGGVLSSFKQAIYFEGQQPLYFVFLNIWRILGHGLFIARFFSILSIGFSIFFVFKLSRIYFPDVNPFYTVFLFALNPFIIWAANEVRLYALSVWIVLMLEYFYYLGFHSNQSKRSHRVWYFISAFLGFYTFYFFSFLLLANGILLLLKKKYKDFIYYAGIMLVIVIPYAFIYKLISAQISLVSFVNRPQIHIIERLRVIFRGTQHYFFSIQMIPLGKIANTSILILAGLFFLFILYKWVIKPKERKVYPGEDYNYLLFRLVVVYFVYIIFLAIFSYLTFNERYLVVVYPLLTLVMVGAINYLFSDLWQKRVAFFIVLFVFLVSNIIHYQRPFKVYDYKKVAGYLNNTIKDNRPLLFYRSFQAPIMSYYLNGKNEVIPLPDSSGYRTEYLSRIESDCQLDSIFFKLNHTYVKFCLVSDDQIKSLYALDLNRDMLRNYINKHFIIEKDTQIMAGDTMYLRVTNFSMSK